MNLLTNNRMRIDSVGCVLLLLLCHAFAYPASLLALQQTNQQPNPPSSDTAEQIWVGWIESPESHLRWIVRVKKQSEKWTGSIQVPDRLDSTPIAVSNLSVTDSDLRFTWQPTNANQEASFVGNVEQTNRAKGLILQGETSVFSQLKRVETLNEESADTLGADSVWTDQTRTRSKILPYDLRLRIYSSGPFFDGTDRILLDSRSSNVIGAPVKLTQSEGTKWSFQIPSLKVEYVAELDPSGETLSGFLMGKSNSKPLQLFNWSVQPKKPADPKSGEAVSDKAITESDAESDTRKSPNDTKASPTMPLTSQPNADSVKIKLDEAKQKVRDLQDGEDEFLLSIASPGSRPKADRASYQLGCTLKLPTSTNTAKFPLAILVSTFDAQERDGIVGEARIYKQLAAALAEKGVASIRYDDRGTGNSTPTSSDYGIQEAASDLKAVLDYAKGLPEIDKTKIGFIGHGFGATLSTQLATRDTSIAFLVCLAPPGLDGSRLLLAESQKISELEKLDDSSLSLLLELQRDLHSMAQKPATNEPQMALEFDDLFRSYWPRLQAAIPQANTSDIEENKASAEQLKSLIEEKIRNDLAGLRTRFNREFLRADPSSSWMILQTPTLAMWGSKDVQVDAEKNQELLRLAMRRNPKNRVSWLVLPNLNHLFQECDTGLPSEYPELRQGIATSAIEAITDWLREQRITTK
jgi:pimeloyl-ACP methyl ester carboxylesterase